MVDVRKVTLLAHRGLTDQARDNSADALSAVSDAVASGVALGIEMDIRSAADDLVLNHDPFEWGLPLFDVSMARLREELGADCPITLGAGLNLLRNVPLINLELKEVGTTERVIEHVLDQCALSGQGPENFIFVSFIPRVVAEVKRLDPRFSAGILIEGNLTSARPSPDRVCLQLNDDLDGEAVALAETMWKVADHINADFISPHWTRLNRLVFELAAARNKHVLPWSVNNRYLLSALNQLPEVNHVVTDFPEMVFEELQPRLKHRKLGPLSESQ